MKTIEDELIEMIAPDPHVSGWVHYAVDGGCMPNGEKQPFTTYILADVDCPECMKIVAEIRR